MLYYKFVFQKLPHLSWVKSSNQRCRCAAATWCTGDYVHKAQKDMFHSQCIE